MGFTDPIPADDRLSLTARRAQLEAAQAKLLVELAREAPDVPMRPELSHLGDERQLRGIPAIGRGVQGAMRHTRPGDNLD